MKRWQNLSLKALGLFAVLALSASPSLYPKGAQNAATLAQIEPSLRTALSEMSTGQDQELMVAGVSAQSRNESIPLAAGMHRGLAAYNPIAEGSSQYSTALKCLTEAVYYEAANEATKGKQAVAQVVINRMRHPAYPNSVCGVVYQGVNDRVCQFSFTCDGALLRSPLRRQWQESRIVAQQALAGKQLADVGTATHYHADYVVPRWAFTLSKLEVIGTHIFYRFPGRAGEPRAFAAQWTRSERVPRINWARMQLSDDEGELVMAEPEDEWVPGLTVAADPTDRHANNDVGGRIDTTKEWRLTIPDPVNSESRYNSAIEGQVTALPEGNDQMVQTPIAEPVE
ncbi:MAG: cell wall hydrolase [Erythrobacter sp.]